MLEDWAQSCPRKEVYHDIRWKGSRTSMRSNVIYLQNRNKVLKTYWRVAIMFARKNVYIVTEPGIVHTASKYINFTYNTGCCSAMTVRLILAQVLRCCDTNRKVAGSIPDGVTGIFHWHNPSHRTLALRSTQPLTEMSTSKISWGVNAAGA